ncbi:hypothetical protein PF008_g30927 [Phytophthora fragariae]|uniref:Uncharacterized protein n=1 Tax=Phytophthora fragariae TaxID=53985 RepID=A0A6G0Q4N3_9STRA|nr:hypothetical protein PF008_g30927 [Phytophthora fragariae]
MSGMYARYACEGSSTESMSGMYARYACEGSSTESMSGMYARYTCEGSRIESIPFYAEIDAVAQEIERVCTSVALDEAALALLLLSKTAEHAA